MVEDDQLRPTEVAMRSPCWLGLEGRRPSPWIEKDKGIARIPIDEAMKIVSQRGLPTFDAQAGAAK